MTQNTEAVNLASPEPVKAMAPPNTAGDFASLLETLESLKDAGALAAFAKLNATLGSLGGAAVAFPSLRVILAAIQSLFSGPLTFDVASLKKAFQAVLSIAEALAALTPSPIDDAVLAILRSLFADDKFVAAVLVAVEEHQQQTK